jgi:hypothetical protein
MFFPRVGNLTASLATLCGLAASLILGYGEQWGLLPARLSFTLIVPGSLVATLISGVLLSLPWPARTHLRPGLTWWTH